MALPREGYPDRLMQTAKQEDIVDQWWSDICREREKRMAALHEAQKVCADAEARFHQVDRIHEAFASTRNPHAG